ncbi:MAG TPA: tetratricopeptide repeat protein [Polyangiaceae bacterium]|nr:tetratricopeptide repeat protein [Polyangiaceae bacterium]
MSQTTFSQPPEPLTSTPSRVPPQLSPEAQGVLAETVRRLRAEIAASTDAARQARLLTEMGDAQERAGDEPAATRDYLAAYSADPTFHEPLEGLVRLLEKRRSLRNLGRLVDALVAAATGADEKVRALLMRAAYVADVAANPAEAATSARDAASIEDAPPAERASAWLALEVLAGRTGDAVTREEALGERVRYAQDPTWRALLLLDRARMRAAAGETGDAIALVQEARSFESAAMWTATTRLEALGREAPAIADDAAARGRAELQAKALEGLALLIQEAVADGDRGETLGVPHWVRSPARVVDAWTRAGEARTKLNQLSLAASTFERAAQAAASMPGDDGRLAASAVALARIRVAEQMGDTALAGRIAAEGLGGATDPGLGAALAMRVAEHAAADGDGPRALDALARAIAFDSSCLPARALQLDLLADGADPAAFAAQLESFADHLSTDEARARSFLLAAYVWAVRAKDTAGAKAALSQAAMYGIPQATAGRLARSLASITGDVAWYEEATKRLLATGGLDAEALSLHVELLRLRATRGDAEATARTLRDMGATPRGAWLARVLEAFAPEPGERARAAIEELAGIETDAELARGLSLVAAMRAHAAGDAEGARARLRELADRDAADPVVAAYLADLDRAAGDHAAAARVASDAAAATTDPQLAAALRLEAAFERWRAGDRVAALEEMEAAVQGAPEAARTVLAWASWAAEPDSIEARRHALDNAEENGGDGRVLALERFALEVGAGDPEAALASLLEVDDGFDGALSLASSLARLAWSAGAGDAAAVQAATTRIAERGAGAKLFAAIEHVRLARESHDPEALALRARRWVEAGGGLPAALEWLSAAGALDASGSSISDDTGISNVGGREDRAARLAVAEGLSGYARDAMLASAALLSARLDPEMPVPFVPGGSAEVRLANLELSPPGCDPRRRAAALVDINGVLGDEAANDAGALSGWSLLAASDLDAARLAFEKAVTARPGDLASWEGLRACAERAGDVALRVRTASELGERCRDAARGAAFWEEAALLLIEVGDEIGVDHALESSFARDATRAVAFDKLFRRVRERKDNDKLLLLVARRLEVTDDPAEIQKLFWEQARVLRERGDQDAALNALEHVTMLDPDHVGALALLGEINIRRGNFEEAAAALARLARLDNAPAKNRVTAGIAAVDLYENKLGRFDVALDVLLSLHRAKLSNLRVRERLARAAARTGSWKEATEILQELMLERPEADGRIEAARLAMAIHRDRLNSPQDAATAIVKLLEEEPGDGEALDMLLQTAHPEDVRGRLLAAAQASLLATLERRPTDLPAVRRLVKVARALRDDALQQAALGALCVLGASDGSAEQAFAQLTARKPRIPQVALSRTTLASILAPGDDGPIAALFILLGPTLAEALGPNLTSCGVGRRDRIDPRSGLTLRNEIAAWAGALGIQEFDLYVGGKEPLDVQGIPGEPPALIVGPSIKAPLSPVIRARVARELLAMSRGTTVARSRDDVTIAAIVVAACRLSEVPIEHPPYAVLAEVERLVSKAIPRKIRKAIAEPCRAIVSERAEPRAWTKRTLASHDRVAAIASGDPGVVLCDTLGVPMERLAQAVGGNARAEEILRFVLSPTYLNLRRSLGLEGS